MTGQTTTVAVDLLQTEHVTAVVQLLNQYAMDPMGGGKPLPEPTLRHLIPRLREQSAYRGLLATREGQFLGLANCFLAFSTFRAEPILNIHDLAVSDAYRGQGIGKALLDAVDDLARSLGCSVITLEVRADNPAQRLYSRHGFNGGDPKSDAMGFWKKYL